MIIFILLFFMAILLILLFTFISLTNHHKEKAEDLALQLKILQEGYIGCKELDLVCFPSPTTAASLSSHHPGRALQNLD